ncbi:MAG: hypothetical protein VKJ04_08825 [Vampirovibrionales bacterium]|nr:hypothetical protein [Vampirovibrionales bacterium]
MFLAPSFGFSQTATNNTGLPPASGRQLQFGGSDVASLQVSLQSVLAEIATLESDLERFESTGNKMRAGQTRSKLTAKRRRVQTLTDAIAAAQRK